MGKKFDPGPINQIIVEAYSDVFFRKVYDRRNKIQRELKAVYRTFFPTMAGMIGANIKPSQLRGTDWSSITLEWAARKYTPVGQNLFYDGLSGDFHDTIRGMDEVSAYGDVELVLSSGFRSDLNQQKINLSGKQPRYKGKWIKLGDLLEMGARIGIDAFPNVGADGDGLLAPFSGRTLRILSVNEPGSGYEHARPFLTPLFDFYRDVKLPRTLRKIANE